MARGISTSAKIRELVVKNYCRNKTIREVADELHIPKTTVWNIIKHYGKTGSILDKKGKSPGRPKLVSDRNKRLLVKLCKKGRRNTLRQITAEWNQETGLNLSRECCRHWIHKCGLKFYKVKCDSNNLKAYFKHNYFLIGKGKAAINGKTKESQARMGKI